MQTFTVALHNEYIRFTLATMLICIAVITVWLLMRRTKLWYSETGSMLEALDTISFRLEHVEDKLGITNRDALDISENIYAIGSMAEESKTIQVAMHEDIRSNKQVQEKMVVEVSGIHELLLADSMSAPKKELPVTMGYDGYGTNRDFEDKTIQYNEREFLYEKDWMRQDKSYDEDEEEYDDIDELWLDDLDDIFPEDDEDEIRKKIRL